ncbi:MetQ/NlpA family ABC transporter substrate-binding protein [Helicobacter cappadocius]|uniref:MetQ/NlpA family ABC transporter substrate-binding protein n=1 Tax=Helicobacter cappadocius TaxID=3063998 RepID=A0AA90Q2U9_9HELI|nr:MULTISPECIES: MetQ/NlpA family ABC transporter substrate-binding protein [unclassified Helicobacter]MDO7253189.1 MetQ/NlpA family ABC transporter substrate-binding protein [Helicobacter sp. faydin-H75]MDP2539113.1 MetQ/NlpA family ABC transporter substrate-binding protein [Helicobacter sp. faydin-H76]
MKTLKIIALSTLLSSSIFAGDLKVGATPVPAAEILEFAKPILAKQGVNLIVQSFTDYVTPDISLNEGSSDANLYQHKPFLDKMNKDRGFSLVAIKPIYIVPLGFYSKKYKSIAEIKDKSTIALPNDPTNYSRALILLNDNGLIKLKDPSNLDSTEFDIIENPKKLKFKQVEAAMLPKVLDGIDAAVINANYALQAGMSLKQAFFHENGKSIYTNVLAARKDNEDNPDIKKLTKVLSSKEVKNFILKKYKGEIIPVE